MLLGVVSSIPQLRLVVAIIGAFDLARLHENLGRRAVDALLEACSIMSMLSVFAEEGDGGTDRSKTWRQRRMCDVFGGYSTRCPWGVRLSEGKAGEREERRGDSWRGGGPWCCNQVGSQRAAAPAPQMTKHERPPAAFLSGSFVSLTVNVCSNSTAARVAPRRAQFHVYPSPHEECLIRELSDRQRWLHDEHNTREEA